MMESPLGNDDLTPAGSRSARASSQLEPAAPLLLYPISVNNALSSSAIFNNRDKLPHAAAGVGGVEAVSSSSEFTHGAIVLLIEAMQRCWDVYSARERSLLFQSVQKELEGHGHALPVEKIRRKWNNLIVTYKRVKERSVLCGGQTKTSWEYFEMMDSILGKSTFVQRGPASATLVGFATTAKAAVKSEDPPSSSVPAAAPRLLPSGIIPTSSHILNSSPIPTSSQILNSSQIPNSSQILNPSPIPTSSQILNSSQIPSSSQILNPSPIPTSSQILNSSQIPTSSQIPNSSQIPTSFQIPNSSQILNSSQIPTLVRCEVSTDSVLPKPVIRPALRRSRLRQLRLGSAQQHGIGSAQQHGIGSAQLGPGPAEERTELLRCFLRGQEERARADEQHQRRTDARERRRERSARAEADAMTRMATALELISSKQDTIIALLQRLADKH